MFSKKYAISIRVIFVSLLLLTIQKIGNCSHDLNLDGLPLELCSTDPMTGFVRDGFCKTDEYDHGTHLICAKVTSEFLVYTKAKGNDLSTPNQMYGFPGLKPGDNWCLCVYRWYQAKKDGTAPRIVSAATNQAALSYFEQFNLSKDDLKKSVL